VAKKTFLKWGRKEYVLREREALSKKGNPRSKLKMNEREIYHLRRITISGGGLKGKKKNRANC